MTYAKVNETLLVKYPYGFSNLQEENPHTYYGLSQDVIELFPTTEAAILRNENLVEVVIEEISPYDSRLQYVEYGSAPVHESGQWILKTFVLDKSQAQLEQEEENAWVQIRDERNRRIGMCDWTQIADVSLTGDQKVAWTTYRQALRDLPQTQTNPFNIIWPDEPI